MLTVQSLYPPRGSTNNPNTDEGMKDGNYSLELSQNGTNQFNTHSVYQPYPIYVASTLPYNHPQDN